MMSLLRSAIPYWRRATALASHLVILCTAVTTSSAEPEVTRLWHMTFGEQSVLMEYDEDPEECISTLPDIILQESVKFDLASDRLQSFRLIGFDPEGTPQVLTDWLPRERLIPPSRPGHPWRVVGDSSMHHGAGRTASHHHGLEQLDPSIEPPAAPLRPLPSGTAYLVEGKDGSASLWSEDGVMPLPVEGKVRYSCLNYGERDPLTLEFVLFETVMTMNGPAGEHKASFWRADGTLAFRDRGWTPGEGPRNPVILDRGWLLLYWFERRESGKVIYPARLLDTRSHVVVRNDIDLPLGFWAVSKDGTVFAILDSRQEPERHTLIHTYRVRPGPRIEAVATFRLDEGVVDIGLNDAGTLLVLRRRTGPGTAKLLLYSVTGTPLCSPMPESGATWGICFAGDSHLYSGISRNGGLGNLVLSRNVYAYRLEE